MPKLLAIYGSPRRGGNTATLLNAAVAGAEEAGADVQKVVLRDLKMSPCLEIYGCQKTGRCAINDDFQQLYDDMLASDGIMLASPIMFYTVSAHTKIFMDRCQSLWVRKYWLEKMPFGQGPIKRRGLFIAAGATHGKKLFEGALLTVRYFADCLDMAITRQVLLRGLDFVGDVQKHPEFLEQAHQAGSGLVEDIKEGRIAPA